MKTIKSLWEDYRDYREDYMDCTNTAEQHRLHGLYGRTIRTTVRLAVNRDYREDYKDYCPIQTIGTLWEDYRDDWQSLLPIKTINVKNLFDLLLSVRVMTDDLHQTTKTAEITLLCHKVL